MSINRADFGFVAKIILDSAGIVLEPGKEYLVEARIEAIMKEQGYKGMEALLDRLRMHPYGPLRDAVVEALTTNETYFFRDQFPFEALKSLVLPKFSSQASRDRTVNIWSAACSSGQEPYSIVMLLRRHFPLLDGGCAKVWASDISAGMLERARQGIYNQTEIARGLPQDYLEGYFRKCPGGWQVDENLRKMVQFFPINLLGPWPTLPKMEVVFLRNVLIYFNAETKKNILEGVSRVLQPGGYLFLGAAETTLHLSSAFERTSFDKAGCFRFLG